MRGLVVAVDPADVAVPAADRLIETAARHRCDGRDKILASNDDPLVTLINARLHAWLLRDARLAEPKTRSTD